MRIYKFITTEQKDIIILEDVLVDNYKIRLIVDTGASKTIIDHNSLFMLSYSFGDFYGHTEFETASGTLEAQYVRIKNFHCLGIDIPSFEICTYNFAANDIYPEYDGILGLDFFQNNKICIDFIKSEITIS
jgi:gag-polyprotein putative aspartyl protease